MTDVEAIAARYAEQPLFKSAHAALMFAFNFAPEQYAPSVIAKLIQSKGGRAGSGKGLVGMDGAGQAGMVLAEVERLGDINAKTYVSDYAPDFIAARFAPHTLPCACRRVCCSGFKPAPAWWAASTLIAAAALEHGCLANYRLRHGLVKRYFGASVNFSELAKLTSVSRDIASQVYAELLPWLKDEEGKAVHAIVAVLKERGFVQ